jgi:hypothetical protein
LNNTTAGPHNIDVRDQVGSAIAGSYNIDIGNSGAALQNGIIRIGDSASASRRT